MDAEDTHRLKHGDDFLLRDAQVERLSDVAADTRRIHVRARSIDSDGNQFPGFGIDYAARERRHAHSDEFLCPNGVEFGERRDVPFDIANPAVLAYQRASAVDAALAA